MSTIQDETRQTKSNGLKIGLSVLGVVALIAASFLIGRVIGLNQEDEATPSTPATSQEMSEETVTDVFDSTEEEVAEVEEETEQIAEENEALVASERENNPELDASKDLNLNGCVLSVAYNSNAAEPDASSGALTLRSTQDSNPAVISCANNSFLNTRNSTPVDRSEVDYLLGEEIKNRISRVEVITPPATGEEILSAAYLVYLDNDAQTIQMILPLGEQVENNRIVNVTYPEKKVVTTETYTNQYFPDFELVYPSSWGFETQSYDGYYPSLLSRSIRLTKDDHVLLVTLSPAVATDCGGPGYETVEPVESLANGLKEYRSQRPTGVIYEYGTSLCTPENTVRTNIDADFDARYANFHDTATLRNMDENVQYWYDIELSGKNPSIEVRSEIRTEVKEILESSTFK